MLDTITITVNKEIDGKDFHAGYIVNRKEWEDAKLHHGIEWFIAYMIKELDGQIAKEATHEGN